MAEDSRQKKDDLPPHPSTRHQPEDISGAHFQQSMPSQLSKEKLHQQRQKCELRRLLKHTHPELKMLDDAVDEELAEVLSSETGATTGETGYEGEVLSRRLIFENCAMSDRVSPYIPKRHMAEGMAGKDDVRKTSAVLEECDNRQSSESLKGIAEVPPDPNRQCEETIRIDVQAARRLFESQSLNTSRPITENKFQGKVSISGNETGAVQKQECIKDNPHRENKSNADTKRLDMPHTKQPCAHISQSNDHEFSNWDETSFEDVHTSHHDPEKSEEIIETSTALFKNNPFIQTNIEIEHSFVQTSESRGKVEDSAAAQDNPIANVKDRTHLFETIQFDKIRCQNQDEVETMVENIKETLNSLYGVNAIHSDGSIIEVNETMIAKKAKFTLSASGPEIKYDEVAEGGAQNFILQLLPRANLKRQITYLKEDSKGRMEATEVKVPMHHHLNTTNQDSEFKTANVAQVVEDILNQDNSLRKGVIIQEDVDKCAEVIVYSLYNYFDEKDVKSYCPPQGAECDRPDPERVDVNKPENQELRKGAIKSTINCLLETSRDQTNQGSVRPEITEKGNVRLFRSCIEKGDLEYLKSLQDEATEEEQELSHNQHLAGQAMELYHEQRNDPAETSEWVPVDVKKLKNMFSGDQKHLEGWKSVQNEATVQGQELPLTQNMDGQSMEIHNEHGNDQAETSEWVPVDVKKLKNMFSGDPTPVRPKQNVCTTLAHYTTNTTSPSALTGQNEPRRKSQSSTEPNVKVYFPEPLKNTCIDYNVQTQKEALDHEMQDDGRIHRAELVQAVDENDEICSLQSAIHSLQQATIEAKALHQASQEKRKSLVQESTKEPVALFTDGNVRHSRTKVEIPQDHADKNCQHDNGEICGEDTESDKLQTTEACSTIGQEGTEMLQKSFALNSSAITVAQQVDEEVVFEGKLQAALNSLERSNINVTRGDFRAAMVYRNSSKPRNERLQNLDTASVQMPIMEESCSVAESKSTQAPKGQDYSKEVTATTTQCAMEAKGLHQASQVNQKFLAQESSKEPIILLMDDNMRHSTPEVETPQLNADKKEEKSINVEHKSDFQHEHTKLHGEDTETEMGQEGTEVVQKPVMVSVNSSEITAAQQEVEEVILRGKLQAALNSLEKSNINVTRGDFTAAMIYQNSSKPHNKRPQNLDAASVQRPPKEEVCSVAELKSTQAPKAQDAVSATSKKGRRPVGPKPTIPQKPVHLKVNQENIQSTKTNNSETTKTNTLRPEETVHQSLQMTSLSCKDEQHLKVNSSANSEQGVVDLPRNDLSDKDMQMSQETEGRHQVQGPFVILERNKTDKNINNLQQDINVTADEKSTQAFTIKEDKNESDKRQIDNRQECKKSGGKKLVRNAPVKPKRVKIAHPDKNPKHMSGGHDSSILTHVVDQPHQTLAVPSSDNPNKCGQTADKHEREMKQGVKVEMREKKGRTETEDERRQRLSVHMDEIVRGNITAAMEIFDNLRKQEELQSILSRVEEIEQDTSEVDVRSLRGVFENVPDWVVSSDRKKHKQVKAETKEEKMPLTRDNTESKSSMAHVFGDLERASEEIMNLKEQTLARLMDIEGAIKKALYSVSTLKSDADIAGLSCLFKESLGAVQESPTSGNISKISIGSSKTKSQESRTAQGNTSLPGNQSASTEVVSAKQRASPPSSPAFISIQSAARKTDNTGVLLPETKICPTCQHSPKTEGKFRTTKTLTCNSPAQNRKRDPRKGGQKQPKSQRELSVLEVQTDREGNSIMGTKTVTENYERTDNFGNKFYSSKTSTVITTQPETTTSTSQAVVSPATHQVTKYPEIRLPINQKP